MWSAVLIALRVRKGETGQVTYTQDSTLFLQVV